MNHGQGQVQYVVAKTNVQAMVGFWMAVGSYLTCGVLGIPALLVSALGARTEPKGWAIAGICVSIPSVLWTCFWVFAMALGSARDIVDSFTSAKADRARIDMATIRPVAERYMVEHDMCPSPERLQKEGALSLTSRTSDPWGKGYRVGCNRPIGLLFVVSAGQDGKFDTDDDISTPSKGEVERMVQSAASARTPAR